MSKGGSLLHPPLLRGAIVQLVEDLGIVLPNIIPFQYNPEKMTRNFKPWNPFDVDPAKRASPAPTAAPFDPEESFQFSLELDATDDLEDQNPIAMATGVASRIAAMQKLVMPTKGLFGDLIGAASALGGKATSAQAERSKVPLALLILGPGIILPVRVTTMSIEVREFTALLYPLMASVQFELRVLTPEVFKCKTSVASDFAKAAYELTRLQEDALAILNFANAVTAARSMLPF
jgi:hypothetical protein